MSDAGYVYVPNWKDFQHYRDQSNPAWIKSYRKLLSNDDYLALSHADRGLLHDLWLLSANDGEGRVSADRRLLARRLNVRRVSLEPLIDAGFIKIRSRKRLDRSYRRSSPESESETKTDLVLNGSTPTEHRPEDPEERTEERSSAVYVLALLTAMGETERSQAHLELLSYKARGASEFDFRRVTSAVSKKRPNNPRAYVATAMTRRLEERSTA